MARLVLDADKTITATGEVYRNENTLPATLTARYRDDSADPVECTLMFPQPHENMKDLTFEEDQGRYLQFRGSDCLGDDIWIPQLWIESRTKSCINGTAELFVKGRLDDFEERVGQLKVYLTSPFNRLSQALGVPWHEFHEDGSITVPESVSRKALQWKLSSGEEAEFSDGYAFSSAKSDLNRSLVRTQFSSITLSFDIAEFGSLKEVINKVWFALEEDIWLLSFLCRKYIPWYEGFVLVEGGGRYYADFRRNRPFLLFKEQREKPDATRKELLVDAKRLTDGTFDTMVSNFRASPLKDVILRVIQNLLITYEDNYIEVDLGIVYTALEMLVYGLSENDTRYLFGQEDFSKLRKRFRHFAHSVLKELGASKSDRSEFYMKLDELNRRPFKSQLEAVLGQHVNIFQFFPEPAEHGARDKCLSDLIYRRNEYIHQGKIRDIRRANTDFHRIRLIIEMTVLTLLGYPLSGYNRQCNDLWYIKNVHLPEDYSFEK